MCIFCFTRTLKYQGLVSLYPLRSRSEIKKNVKMEHTICHIPVELSFPTLTSTAKLNPQQLNNSCQSNFKILILYEWQDLARNAILYLTWFLYRILYSFSYLYIAFLYRICIINFTISGHMKFSYQHFRPWNSWNQSGNHEVPIRVKWL